MHGNFPRRACQKSRHIVNESVEISLRTIAVVASLNRVAVPNIWLMDY